MLQTRPSLSTLQRKPRTSLLVARGAFLLPCLLQYVGDGSVAQSFLAKWPVPPLPLAQARPRSQKSGQNGGSTPTPCLDKAVHARDTRGSKRVGEPLDGDGEGLRMGNTLSKAALCSISFPFRMYFKWM